MKITANTLKRWAYFLLAAFSFLLIWQIDFLMHPWLKAVLLMTWLTLFLIVLSRVFLLGTDISITAAYVLFYIGALLSCLFLVWMANFALKPLNLLFAFLDWEFRIGNLFKGIWYYLFSWPALISGLILFFAGILWESDIQYRAWRIALTKSLRTSKA